jgi:uncharacterized protein involved in exopolysaccharide biosynthesis
LPKEFVSGTTIYTGIASGYSISSTEGAQSTLDYFAVTNAFDNLITTVKSKNTIEEVSIKLLAQHLLLEQPDPSILGQEGFERLRGLVSEEDRSQMIISGNFAATVDKITKIKNSSGDNIVLQLLNTPKSYYSIETILSNLTSERKSSSDFIDISYKAGDPGVCVNTVKFLSESFITKYKYLKGAETINVVKWFEARLRESAGELNNSENKLKDFGIRNKIINYNEQSKFIAEAKEDNETDYYKELMNYEGKKRAIARLEDKLESREILLKNNAVLNKLRRELSVVNEQLVRSKLYSNPKEDITRLAQKGEDLKKEIRLYVLQAYSLNNTIEGVPQQNLLNRWLEEILSADEADARLNVYVDRRKEFDRQYSEFAPLGMQISRLEREVSVNEKQYLEILHGLHLAKLRQQNIELSNNLQVMDNPTFPLKPLSSRRLLLIIISFVTSFFLILAYFVTKELLDSSVKNTAKAEQLTGLKIFSALPDNVGLNNLSINKIENTLLDYAVSNLKIEIESGENVSNNYLITILSSREQEGKTYAGLKLAEKLYSLDSSILFITNDESIEDSETDDRKLRIAKYDITSKLFGAKSVDNLLPEFSRVNGSNYNFVILEIPAISINALPNQLVKNSRLSLMMLDARRSWTNSDNSILNLYRKASGNDNRIMLWLNHVDTDNLETLIGSRYIHRSKKGTNNPSRLLTENSGQQENTTEEVEII